MLAHRLAEVYERTTLWALALFRHPPDDAIRDEETPKDEYGGQHFASFASSDVEARNLDHRPRYLSGADKQDQN